uniref:ORF80 n=1 Tax=Phytophthora infestans TaxID=4787 RepID=Q52V78_PHYIN|nr:ORF80 [Phytophthora infestans]AAW67068.1 ORF80 [Phytophthora infestans]ADK36695.1 unknown [Phytophthora infestans]ADZ32021.1 ORF80 [Phytophthora infestans]ADZ32029.1 ORF80 [Phytophthora infestans]
MQFLIQENNEYVFHHLHVFLHLLYNILYVLSFLLIALKLFLLEIQYLYLIGGMLKNNFLPLNLNCFIFLYLVFFVIIRYY